MASYWSNWIQSENSEKTIVHNFTTNMGHLSPNLLSILTCPFIIGTMKGNLLVFCTEQNVKF